MNSLNCGNKKICKGCNIFKSEEDFYKYKNGDVYIKCISCFNRKMRCEFCNREFNKTYLSKHIKNIHKTDTNNTIEADALNRTLIVGPSFCGKTFLLLNKLQLIRLDNPKQQIKIITRSPEQYENIQLEDVSVEDDLEDRTIQDFQNCCVVFDDMLDSNQKLLDPFFTRGRHNDLDVYYLSQSYFDLPKRTIRNNSNIIILFQQTLKDVENIYRDFAGFDMSYDEFKSLCREAWKEKYNYLLINRLEDKNGCKYKLCNESNPEYKIFNPQTDPF